MRTRFVAAGIAGLALALLVFVPLPASAAPTAKPGKHHGHVYAPWPRNDNGRAPKQKLARNLARQVGPTKVRKRRHRNHRFARPPAWSGRETAPAPLLKPNSNEGKLYLVRSFDIPPTDKLYKDLVNYSFTYDNGLAALAFVASHNRGQSMQVLDQLQELQNDDGSLYFAYDVSNGANAPVKRSGAIAWAGIAAAAFRRTYDSDRYDDLLGGVVKYLISQRGKDGLVRGGPDVSWVSTQHNLLTLSLLGELQSQLEGTKTKIGGYSAADYGEFAESIGKAAIEDLLVEEGSSVHFRQGTSDSQIPVDVQSFGAMYLNLRGDDRDGDVAAYLQQPEFLLGPRESADDAGVVSGLRPYFDETGPDTIWSEGTIEAGLALGRLEIKDKEISSGISSLAETMKGKDVGPIGADRNIRSDWGEYHTWPTSAAASWLLMLKNADDLILFSH